MDLLPSPVLPRHLSHHCYNAWSAHTGFAVSKSEEKGCIWLSSRAILFLETHTKVMDFLLVTLPSFTRASSPINLASVTILLPNSLMASPSSSSHTFSRFTPLPIRFLPAFQSAPFSTGCFPSSSDNPSSFPLDMPSTFPADSIFQSIDFGLHICTHLLCSSGRSRHQRTSWYCQFSCRLYCRC